jgi:hypothetical protein
VDFNFANFICANSVPWVNIVSFGPPEQQQRELENPICIFRAASGGISRHLRQGPFFVRRHPQIAANENRARDWNLALQFMGRFALLISREVDEKSGKGLCATFSAHTLRKVKINGANLQSKY